MNAEFPSRSARALYDHGSLDALISPRRVAIIGASERAGSFGLRTLENLAGFGGELFLVNDRYSRIGDRECYPSVAALKAPPDCAILAVPRPAVEQVLLDCAGAGVKSAIVFASGYAETGSPERAEEQARLTEIAASTGIRVIGPNCVGLMNFREGYAPTFAPQSWPLSSAAPGEGRIGIVTQSGALALSLAQARGNGVAFSHLLTSGNACDVDVADFVAYLAEDPGCGVILCSVEGVTDGARFLKAARMAAEAGKPLLVLKLAQGQQGAQAALSHTGTFAGASAVFRAACENAGAIWIERWEAMVETASFLVKAGKPRGQGAAILATSGGAAIYAADCAERQGVPLPQPSGEVRRRIADNLPDFATPQNPFDVTAQFLNLPNALPGTLSEILNAPDYATLVVAQTRASEELRSRVGTYGQYAAEHGKPVCMTWMSGWSDGAPGLREIEAHPNLALFRSMDTCFEAIRIWRQLHDRGALLPGPRHAASPAVRREVFQQLAAQDRPVLTEAEAKTLLAAYGVEVVGETLAQAEAEAIEAARAYAPGKVALKIVSPDIAHKSDIGGVELDLVGDEAVAAAYRRILAAAAQHVPGAQVHGVTVQPMVPQGVQMMIGGHVDPQFGPVVLIGAGGVLTELLADTVLELAPVGEEQALQMIARLRAAPLLDGYRGAAATDRRQLALAICAVSELMADHADRISELDVNPVICTARGVVAVDGLIRLGGRSFEA